MSRSLPGPGDFCHGCNRRLCRCLPEPDPDAYYEASYEAGYDACLADGYCERPMTEWVYVTGSRTTWDADAKRVRYHMVLPRFAELTSRHRHASARGYRQWFERQVGLDLEAYLAGYDDAGAGLPSAVRDPEAHARAEVALASHGQLPEPEALQPSPAAVEDDGWTPF